MKKLTLRAMCIAATATVLSLTAFSTASPVAAATIPMDITGGSVTSVNVTGINGGTMFFTLSLGGELDSGASNNFALDVFSAGGSTLSSLNLFPSNYAGPASNVPYGNLTGLNEFGFDYGDTLTWSVQIFPGDLSPLILQVTTTLNALFAQFSPTLTVDFTGDLELAVAQTPIPAALPLFVTGLGLLGFIARRHKRTRVAGPGPIQPARGA